MTDIFQHSLYLLKNIYFNLVMNKLYKKIETIFHNKMLKGRLLFCPVRLKLICIERGRSVVNNDNFSPFPLLSYYSSQHVNFGDFSLTLVSTCSANRVFPILVLKLGEFI